MIYLDHAATSPVRPEVLDAMWPHLAMYFANASSRHELGRMAAAGLEWAREITAEHLACAPDEIVFTSGGTESVNMAIKGVALATPRGKQIVTTPIEHEAVLETCKHLAEHHGFEITMLPVDRTGLVDLDALREVIRPDTTLCSIQYANNEIGTVQPIERIASICREYGVPLHLDAVQAAGTLSLDIDAELLSISGHKFGGPKGVGVLRVASRLSLEPLVHGGGQERGLRSGTSNVASAVGLAQALSIVRAEGSGVVDGMRSLRDELIASVLRDVSGSILTGHTTSRLANHASFCFPGVSGEAMLIELETRGVVCSSGSACAAGRDEPSYVLTAIGLDDAVSLTALRFTLGPETNEDEIATACRAIPASFAAIS